MYDPSKGRSPAGRPMDVQLFGGISGPGGPRRAVMLHPTLQVQVGPSATTAVSDANFSPLLLLGHVGWIETGSPAALRLQVPSHVTGPAGLSASNTQTLSGIQLGKPRTDCFRVRCSSWTTIMMANNLNMPVTPPARRPVLTESTTQ